MEKRVPGIVTDEGFSPDSVRTTSALSPYEHQQSGAITPQQTMPSPSVGRVLARIVWVIAAMFIAFYANVGYENFAGAETAPQQAAAAGWACFQVIVPYVFARAVAESLTA